MSAFPGWSGRTAYNRGQILYRIAEVLEGRADQLAGELAQVLFTIGLIFVSVALARLVGRVVRQDAPADRRPRLEVELHGHAHAARHQRARVQPHAHPMRIGRAVSAAEGVPLELAYVVNAERQVEKEVQCVLGPGEGSD